MAKVNISSVRVVGPNPSPTFSDPFRFEITLECFESLPDDIEFKLIYVGSAESDEHDQMLDSVLVGPLPEGRLKFEFVANAPDPKKIPAQEAVGVTVALLSCSYRDQTFVKIGYFVKNYYIDPELCENPPTEPQFEKLHREIVTDEPRVTKFIIKWDDERDIINGGDMSDHHTNGTNGVSTNGNNENGANHQ